MTANSPWAPVRHVLARLATWHRKARFIVQFAAQFPQVLDQYSCEKLRLPESLKLPLADHKSNLASALVRMLPQHEQGRIPSIVEALEDLRDFNLHDSFTARCARGIDVPVHAETYLWEHFYQNNLQFFNGHRYIGCSKPSCYCCSLYFIYHKGQPVTRSSHGTAWVPWSPPLMADKDKFEHTRDIMNDMVKHIRRAVMIEIAERLPSRERLPDSTSGQASPRLV